MRSSNRTIGITIGDPSGIGPEVIAKALKKNPFPRSTRFYLIGKSRIFAKYGLYKTKNISIIETPDRGQNKKTHFDARLSLDAIDCGIALIKEKKITALVTAPVCKESICRIFPGFKGHTEYLADAFKTKNVGMMFVADKLRTVIVTRHTPIKDVSREITQELVLRTIQLTHHSLKHYFTIPNPRIAVCGLNPHAGEKGIIGNEEITEIIPALKTAVKKGIKCSGPFAADTLFSPDIGRKCDAVIAMYHDQGLIPVKTLAFRSSVNLTIGLPFIRTSPAHGTAFDIAGKNKADPSSMVEAIKLVVELGRQ